MRSVATQEIPIILWNPNVHYHIHNNPSLVPILSEINSIHVLPSYFFNIGFDSNIHLLLALPCRLLPSGFPIRTLHALLFYPIRATCPTHPPHPPRFHARIIFGDKYKSWSSSPCSFLQSLTTSSALYPQTPSACVLTLMTNTKCTH
jgi:hypothetical protein